MKFPLKITLCSMLMLLASCFEDPINIEESTKACHSGDADNCVILGSLYFADGGEVTQDYAKAREYYSRACNLKNGFGCFYLGILYQRGFSVPKNIDWGMKYFKISCDLNEVSACLMLGGLYTAGKDVTHDKNLAITYFKKACDLGEKVACYALKL